MENKTLASMKKQIKPNEETLKTLQEARKPEFTEEELKAIEKFMKNLNGDF
jgi:hypothetical protein